MNRWLIVILGAITISVVGCCAGAPDDRAVNTALICSYNDIAINNAILVQHTLYPYHFVTDAPVLNELGVHDLKVLAEHYRDHPGPLTVRQGDVPQELYEARMASVRQALVEAGVAAERITIGEGAVGGDGATADRVLTVLEHEKKNAAGVGANSGGASGSGATGTAGMTGGGAATGGGGLP